MHHALSLLGRRDARPWSSAVAESAALREVLGTQPDIATRSCNRLLKNVAGRPGALYHLSDCWRNRRARPWSRPSVVLMLLVFELVL